MLVRLKVLGPGSKSAVPEKEPVVWTLPLPSTAMPKLSELPMLLAQTKLPLLSSLETKTSELPLLVKLKVPGPGSKSAVVLRNWPVVWTLPLPSTAMPKPKSKPVPPMLLAQTKLPSLSSLETKTSEPPLLVRLKVGSWIEVHRTLELARGIDVAAAVHRNARALVVICAAHALGPDEVAVSCMDRHWRWSCREGRGRSRPFNDGPAASKPGLLARV